MERWAVPSEQTGPQAGEPVRCDGCGARLRFVSRQAVGPEHFHDEYECPGCLSQYLACSEDGFKMGRHRH